MGRRVAKGRINTGRHPPSSPRPLGHQWPCRCLLCHSAAAWADSPQEGRLIQSNSPTKSCLSPPSPHCLLAWQKNDQGPACPEGPHSGPGIGLLHHQSPPKSQCAPTLSQSTVQESVIFKVAKQDYPSRVKRIKTTKQNTPGCLSIMLLSSKALRDNVGRERAQAKSPKFIPETGRVWMTKSRSSGRRSVTQDVEE